MPRRTLTLKETAEAIGCGESTLRRYISRDGDRLVFDSGQEIPIVRLGINGRVLVPVVALERLLGEIGVAS